MTVFKGYFLIIKRNLFTILMYIGIFVGVTSMIQLSYSSGGVKDGFSAAKINVAILDRDGGELSSMLGKLMEEQQNLVEIEDEEQVIQEKLFYGDVEYVLVIPQGVEERLTKGENAVQSMTVPDSISAYYVEEQVNSALNEVRICLTSGLSMEKSCEIVYDAVMRPANVELIDVNGNNGTRESYNSFFSYMPYAFLGAAIMSMSLVIMEFKKKDIRRRVQSCAVPFFKQNAALVAVFALVGTAVWGICMVLQVLMYHGGIFKSPHAGLYLLNSGVMMVVSLSLAFLTGILSSSSTMLSALNNIITLGLCFLGGVFVPLEMLGGTVGKVSQFLPTYWYSKINGILGDYSVISSELQKTISSGVLIQLLFAAACFAVALALKKVQLQEKS